LKKTRGLKKTSILLTALASITSATSATINPTTNALRVFATPEVDASEYRPGGEASVSPRPFPSLMLATNNMPASERADFYAGKALGHQPWVKAPTITDGRDGLGPIYNARSCLACHINGGRGHMPDDANTALFSGFVRISLTNSTGTGSSNTSTENGNTSTENSHTTSIAINGVIAEPNYGDQLQSQSTALTHQLRRQLKLKQTQVNNSEAPPEAYIYIDWIESHFNYPDGKQVTLRAPQLRIENLGYGPLHPDTRFSLRNAPAIHGMGLIELIGQADIDQLSDPDDRDKDGISGRVNQVWDVKQNATVPGRFGLKANRPNNISIVTAAAFAGDIGISNPLFPRQPCTTNQLSCLEAANGNDPQGHEISAESLELVNHFTRNIGVPTRQHPTLLSASKALVQKQGRELFYQVGCQACHQPRYTTTSSPRYPHLSRQTIWPYSDFLLHDMGEALSDRRSDYLASGSEWRTTPLWSIGLRKAVNGSNNLLHDGRARTIEEAILWHGGEAKMTKNRFIHLNVQQRQWLIDFVEAL
jgi:CxxC motif-containing protein (DUF1111 family)